MHTYIYIHLHNIYTYIDTYIYTYIHTYIHTYIVNIVTGLPRRNKKFILPVLILGSMIQ